jgi:CheY-like chemotaxis protein
MDGLACTSKIREYEAQGLLRGHVPIIAVTANARSEQIATLLAAGMVRHPDSNYSSEYERMVLTKSCRTTSYPNPSASQNSYPKSKN